MAALNNRSLMISSKICRSCSSTLRPARGFANSAALQQTLPPESPNYVDYPKPPQPNYPDLPPVKGVLPTPRNVFKNRSRVPKDTKEFLQKSAPEPSTAAPADATPRTLWKSKMAEMRRRNLREGISELSVRKAKTDKITSTKSLERQHRNRDLLLSPEAEDERLTRPTMDIALRNFLNGGAANPPETAEEIEARRKHHEEIQAAKAQERQDALHTLYVHAREFIVTEEQLNQAVEEAFEDNGENIWRVKGAPRNISYMLRVNATREGRTKVSQDRMKRLAESLTGGKL